MKVKTASDEDSAYVKEANNKLLAYHQSFDDFYQPIESVADEAGQKKEIITFIAKENDQAVGFLTGYIMHSPVDRSVSFAYIQAVWVEEASREQGVAKALIETFESAVQEKGIDRIELSVDIQNQSGKQLWDAFGYEVYQERRWKRLT
jgi:ribosomal protein S18 acetylase RimI-like enzyme